MKVFRNFFRRLITFLEVFSGSSTSTLTVSTAGELGPLGQFVLQLTCSESARDLWLTNRQQAIANSGLSQQDQQLLTSGTTDQITAQIVAESGGTGSKTWICIWIRSASTH